MSLDLKMPRGKCAVCGKEVPVRDIRSKGAVYCGRIHAAIARYSTRYMGANSRVTDRDKVLEKTKRL